LLLTILMKNPVMYTSLDFEPLRADRAHARIVRIDLTAALARLACIWY